MGPPGAWRLLGAGLPFLERGGQLVIRPVLVLVCCGRVDDAGDVAGTREREGYRTAEQFRALVDGARWRDVVLLRGLHVDRGLYLGKVKLHAVEDQLALGQGVLAVELAQ